MHWLHHPTQRNVANLNNNVRREASRHFRNKKKEYLKAKIEELETNSKIKNIGDMYRGISDLKKGYQPRTNIVMDEKGELVTDCHSILARWRNHFSQLLNIHGVNDVRQTELHIAEPLVPEPSAFEVEMTIEKLKSHKSPGIYQIPTELRQGAGQFALRSINVSFLFGIRRNWVRNGRNRSLCLSIRRAIKQIVVIIRVYHFCQLCIKFYPTSVCRGNYWGSLMWI